MIPPAFLITPVRTLPDIEITRTLFTAYADSLGIDLGYQDFAEELASLPGKYRPPRGELLLARAAEGTILGCAALRPLEQDELTSADSACCSDASDRVAQSCTGFTSSRDVPRCCEMKRLYVCPEGRGSGVGKALVQAVLSAAERAGYREIRLDTLPSMTAAQSLYRRLGFQTMPPYYDTPIPGTVFMRRMLQAGRSPDTATPG